MRAEHAPQELLDVVDADGNPTGERRTKTDIHTQGLWHRDVHVWLTDGVRMLEQQRAWDKKIMPGAWDVAVGGHVAAGESYRAAALRETDEELGMRFAPERFRYAGRLAVEMVMEPGPRAWTHRTVGDHFVVVEHDLDIAGLRLQEDEVIGARLYPIDQLETDLASTRGAQLHAPQPDALWQLGIAAMREAARS